MNVVPIVTPLTAEMAPERRDAYITQSRQELAGQGHHAAAWALEAIDSLVGDLHRTRLACERLAMLAPPPAIAPNPLSVVNPVRPRKRRP